MPLPISPTPHEHVKHSPHVHVYGSPIHDPVAFFCNPTCKVVRIVNLAKLLPHKVAPFPEEAEMLEMAQRLTLDGSADAEEKDEEQQPGWNIAVSRDMDDDERIEACAMGLGGAVIVGVGSRGSIWVWVAER
jgi:polycomb protein EED